jgi:hypothetical protein
MRVAVWSVVVAVVVAALAPAAPAAAEPPAWKDGARRTFVAGELAGGLVAKAQVMVGRGRPHWSWVGAEALALSTVEFGALYAGARARLPFLDVTLGARRTRSYVHPRLAAMPAHATIDGDGAARVTSLDASALAYAPAPAGYLMLWGDLVRPLGIDGGEHVFEEMQRAVVGDGLTLAVRASYLVALDHGRLLVGPMGEHVRLGGRGAGVWRVGVAGFWDLTPRWQAALVLTAPVSGPDELGFIDGMWGTGVMRFRWASGAT